MSRAFRAFMMIYAVAMVAVSAGVYIQSRPKAQYGEFISAGAASLCYLVLALAYLGGNDRQKSPTRAWLAVVYALTLSMLAAMLLSEDAVPMKGVASIVTATGCVLGCLGATTLLLFDMRSKGGPRWIRARRWLVPASLVIGAGLVCSSVFLNTTKGDIGWNIIARKAPWITSEVNVATPVWWGHTIEWLKPVYSPGGYAFYVLGLATTLMLLFRLAVSRGSLVRMRASSGVTWLAALISLTCLWVLTDIFWAWHLDLSETPWAAITATCLWLAGPVFGVLLLAPFVRGKPDAWRIRALLIFQLPIAAFNFLMLLAYWGSDLDMPGLGMMIVGLQLESWACMDLLCQDKRTKPVLEGKPMKVDATSA
jgi:hypothetical protein